MEVTKKNLYHHQVLLLQLTYMTKSAEKRCRQQIVARARNRAVKSKISTFMKKARVAIASGDESEAVSAFSKAQSQVASASSKGVLHKNAASRKIKRLAKALKSIDS